MVMLEGVHIASAYMDEVSGSLDKYPHSVEYIAAGQSQLRVDHVQVAEAAPRGGADAD